VRRRIKTFLIVLAITSTSVTAANAEVVTFPCTGGTYSVEMPAAMLTKSNGCTGNMVIDPSVKSIGERAFIASKITSVVIPDSVTSIGLYAFQYSNLTAVIIPNSVTSLGFGAFYGSEIRSVVISSAIKEIKQATFHTTENLTSVVIPVGVQTIGNSAFEFSGLSSITIPKTVISIGDFAFRFTNFTTFDIPDTVKSIGWNAFDSNVTSIIYCGEAKNLPTAPTCPAERKAIIDAAAKAAAKAAPAKKTTITCVKGKLIKKVTALKPKCPSGYRAK
jgi:hypothetical protein